MQLLKRLAANGFLLCFLSPPRLIRMNCRIEPRQREAPIHGVGRTYLTQGEGLWEPIPIANLFLSMSDFERKGIRSTCEGNWRYLFINKRVHLSNRKIYTLLSTGFSLSTPLPGLKSDFDYDWALHRSHWWKVGCIGYRAEYANTNPRRKSLQQGWS